MCFTYCSRLPDRSGSSLLFTHLLQPLSLFLLERSAAPLTPSARAPYSSVEFNSRVSLSPGIREWRFVVLATARRGRGPARRIVVFRRGLRSSLPCSGRPSPRMTICDDSRARLSRAAMTTPPSMFASRISPERLRDRSALARAAEKAIENRWFADRVVPFHTDTCQGTQVVTPHGATQHGAPRDGSGSSQVV